METISHHQMPAGSQKAIYDRVVILYAEKWAVEENKELNKNLVKCEV